MRFLRALLFSAIAALHFPSVQAGATPFPVLLEIGDNNDSLINLYLKDTLHAASRIRELTEMASKEMNRRNDGQAAKDFELALILQPYAKDSFEILSKLNSRFASLTADVGDVTTAVEYFKSALAYHKKFDGNPSDRSYNLMGNIGSMYLRTQQYDSALYYFSMALDEASGTGKKLWIAGAYNNLGVLAYRSHQTSKATAFFNKALNLFPINASGDSVLYGSIIDNLAMIKVDSGQYAQALTLFKQNIEALKAIGGGQDAFKAQAQAIRVLLSMGKYNEAISAIHQLEAYAVPRKLDIKVNNTLTIYELKKDYYSKTSQWPDAFKYEKLISQTKDSLNLNNQELLKQTRSALSQSESRKFLQDLEVKKQQLTQNEKDLETARHAAQMNRILIIMAIAIMVLFVSYFVNRGKIQQKLLLLQKAEQALVEKDLQYQRLEREKLEQELKYKKGDLSDLSIYLGNLKEVYDNLLSKLVQVKLSRPSEQKEMINEIIKELDSQVHSGEKLSMIQENIEEVNKEYYDKLLKSFPDLTKSEIELCGLLKLNMSNKEIAALKNISAESVKMARYRLRKKLSLQPEDDIYRFLAEV
jgi:DNA-binding CsgD family transcriptional regulator/Tfp pilus assembly protein PilF